MSSCSASHAAESTNAEYATRRQPPLLWIGHCSKRTLELCALELTGGSGGVVESHHAGFEDPTGLQAEWAEAGHVGKQGRASADDDWIDTDVVVVH